MEQPRSFDEMSKQQVVEQYKGLVEGAVEQIWDESNGLMSIGDMRSCAYEGLLQAHANFDAGGKAEFATYAYKRIRGAVIDGLRRARWGPRTRKVERRDDVTAMSINESGGSSCGDARSHSEAEGTAGGGRPDRTYFRVLMMEPIEFERLDLAERESQDETVTRRQLRELIYEAMGELGEIERTIVRLHDLEGKSFSEIADVVHCSKSWVSRLRERALGELRDYVEQVSEPETDGKAEPVELAPSRPKAA